MPSALLSPRAEPGHLLPALAGGAVLLVALPLFLLADWPLGGWAIAAVLYVAVHVLDYVIARSRVGPGRPFSATASFSSPRYFSMSLAEPVSSAWRYSAQSARTREAFGEASL